jgi:ABC-type Fe3+ transport system substrate-binding protein
MSVGGKVRQTTIKSAAALCQSAVVALLLLSTGAFAASAQDWQAGANADWQRVLVAAKKEGRLSVAGPAELAQPITDGFLRDTGIDVEYLGGEARDRSSRLGREIRSGNVTLDFVFSGGVELPLVTEGYFEDEKARLMLPGVTDPKNWSGGALKWVDNTQQYMLQTHAYVTSVPIYDGNAVKLGELTSWKDLLNPKFKGKIVVYDPRSGGPGVQVAGYVGSQMGMDFLKSLYIGQDVVYSLNSRQMAEWIARGVYTVGLGVLTSDYITLKDAGITNLIPADLKDGPGTLSGGFSVVLLPKGAPHPNAATVFLNWFASQPGQKIYSAAMKTVSRRSDIEADPSIPSYTVPKPGIAYQDQYNEGWLTNVRAVVIGQALQAIGGK